jgi:hypothetical protein
MTLQISSIWEFCFRLFFPLDLQHVLNDPSARTRAQKLRPTGCLEGECSYRLVDSVDRFNVE